MGNKQTEIEKKGETAMAVYDFGADAGAGAENQTQEDVKLPFLKILEGLSPEVTKKVSEGGIEGARAGMILNTVSGQLTDGDKGLVIVPAYTRHVFTEWRPERGGFVGVHELGSPVVKDAKAGSPEFGVYSTDYTKREGKWPYAGNELVETFYVYGVEEETGGPVVLAFTSTRISGYKDWNSKRASFQVQGPSGAKVTPPLFAHRVRVQTRSHTKGTQTWSTFQLTPAEGDMLRSLLAPADPRYQAAKQVYEAIMGGLLKTDHAASGAGGGAKRTSGDPAPDNTSEIPF